MPLSGECRSVAEDEERRLVMTGSVCLDKFIVDTDLLSVSGAVLGVFVCRAPPHDQRSAFGLAL